MASETGSQRRYLGRLVTHRNGEMTLFLPFVLVDESDEMMRVVLVNPLIGDLQSKTGQPPASKASIEALPGVEIGEEDSVTECAICLDGMKVAKVMPCKHMFHSGCVEKWLRIHGSCPVCRFQMPVEDEQGSNKGQADEGEDGSGRRRGLMTIWIPFSVTSEILDQSSNQETEDRQSSD